MSALVIFLIGAIVAAATAQNPSRQVVELGPRPFYLVDQMEDGALKSRLARCKGPFKKSDFSIGHRGAPLLFPEHTEESYVAAARMGAGILECDVTFTGDGELVCRHDQCDLHTTTDILLRPELAAKCSEPFSPAAFDAVGTLLSPASARCCASDLTLAEFKSLCGKMDGSDRTATTVEEYQGGTAAFRTDLYATCGTVLSHVESIELFRALGAKFTPELKSGAEEDVQRVFGSQEAYARRLIEEYRAAGVSPRRVYAQSFNLEDVLYWIERAPAFGRRAVFLDGGPIPRPAAASFLQDLADRGVKIVAPPMPMLLDIDAGGEIVPSEYARAARRAGLDILSWTTERSGRIQEDVVARGNAFYYQTTLEALGHDGNILDTIDVLAREVGIIGLFSDWPATTTFYANCMLER